MSSGLAASSTSAEEAPIGVLVMAYGTPAGLDQVEEYYTHIRHGRAPSDEQLADLIARYDAIGGVSPMRERTMEQISTISKHLDALTESDSGAPRFVVELGQKHTTPFIEDGVQALLSAGAKVIVGLVLAPHYSAASVGQYHERAVAELAGRGEYRAIDDWSQDQAFIDFTAESLRSRLNAAEDKDVVVVFTAHSLPLRVLENDPYEERLVGSARAIADAAGIAQRTEGAEAEGATSGGVVWRMGWQSAGRTPEPWIGPDILEIINSTAQEIPGGEIVVVPQGFTSDHLEVLFDLDIEARRAAESVGLTLDRTETINADSAVMKALADLVAEAAS